ncbi:unnamed protein product [Symbiodinium microadriaticum]|nr:unnamed protein product [Symbiodinium microadriaticum]
MLLPFTLRPSLARRTEVYVAPPAASSLEDAPACRFRRCPGPGCRALDAMAEGQAAEAPKAEQAPTEAQPQDSKKSFGGPRKRLMWGRVFLGQVVDWKAILLRESSLNLCSVFVAGYWLSASQPATREDLCQWRAQAHVKLTIAGPEAHSQWDTAEPYTPPDTKKQAEPRDKHEAAPEDYVDPDTYPENRGQDGPKPHGFLANSKQNRFSNAAVMLR